MVHNEIRCPAAGLAAGFFLQMFVADSFPLAGPLPHRQDLLWTQPQWQEFCKKFDHVFLPIVELPAACFGTYGQFWHLLPQQRLACSNRSLDSGLYCPITAGLV